MGKSAWPIQSKMHNIPITNHNSRVQVLPSTHLDVHSSACHIQVSSQRKVSASAVAGQLRASSDTSRCQPPSPSKWGQQIKLVNRDGNEERVGRVDGGGGASQSLPWIAQQQSLSNTPTGSSCLKLIDSSSLCLATAV